MINDPSPPSLPSDDRNPWVRCSRSGRLLAANQAFLDLLSFDSEADLRRAVPKVQDLFADHRDRARLDASLAEGLTHDEVRWIRSDGTSVWVRVRLRSDVGTTEGTPAHAEDTVDPSSRTFLHLSLEDVTGRRHLEQQLREARRMQTLGQLAGGMAHDFNNLLTALLTQLELLEEGIRKGDLDSALEDLAEVRRSATTGSRMIKHLLSYSHGQRIQLQEQELEGAIGDAMRLVRPMVPRGVDVHVDISEVGPVLIDAGAVEQMLQALATRAWTSMPGGGRLDIRASRGSFDDTHLRDSGWGDPGEYGVVTVTDNGTGMSATTVSRLFQPFFVPEEGEGGSGLNLSIVYGLMKQHRGFIQVESEPDSGTTVRLYFRLARAASPETSHVEEFRPDGAETILFVEDDASLRRVAGRVLRAHGFHVLEAENGRKALELIASEGRPDLLITDLVMPSMSGLELLERLEAEKNLPPVLMTSGYRPEALVKGKQTVPDHPFLEKPWTVEALVTHVQSILRKRRAMREGGR